MSDPAIEAAQRAWATEQIPTTFTRVAESAARESLKPIRELHRPTGWGGECVVCFDSEGRGEPWPCATARLIYTSEELA